MSNSCLFLSVERSKPQAIRPQIQKIISWHRCFLNVGPILLAPLSAGANIRLQRVLLHDAVSFTFSESDHISFRSPLRRSFSLAAFSKLCIFKNGFVQATLFVLLFPLHHNNSKAHISTFQITAAATPPPLTAPKVLPMVGASCPAPNPAVPKDTAR